MPADEGRVRRIISVEHAGDELGVRRFRRCGRVEK
jgi:hypothetical protein